jgi:hypothetical protein
MSISSVSSASVAQSADNSAKVQLERDQNKVTADTAPRASQATLDAEKAQNEQATRRSPGSTIDMYL